MTQHLEKEIYIPRRLEKTSFKWLPLSTKLTSFLTQNNISLIGDLRKINGKLLNNILTDSVAPFPELKHYILAFQENRYNEVSLIGVEGAVLRVDDQFEIESSTRQSSKIEQIFLRTISIPLPARKWAISYLPISSWLIDKLKKCNYLKLIHLNGVRYARFRSEEFFEQKDILDLFIFLSQLQSKKNFPSIEKQVLKAEQTAKASSAKDLSVSSGIERKFNKSNKEEKKIEFAGNKIQAKQETIRPTRQPSKIELLLSETIVIPLPARKWKISALPLSKSLIHKLQISGFEKLLGVHGKTYESFSYIKIFEIKDIFELSALINKLATISGFRSIEVHVSAFVEETKTEAVSASIVEKAELGKEELLPIQQRKRRNFFGRKVEKPESREVKFLPTESLRTQFPPAKFVIPLFTDQNFVVPNFLKTISIDKFDLPTRLALIFESLQIQLLGDLEKISFKDFRKTNSYTADGEVSFRKFLFQIENLKPQISDVLTEQIQDKPETFDSAALMRNINDFISRLPALDKDIFLDRVGGISGEEVLTFEAIAHKNEITRERSYQIFHRTLNKFKETLQNRAAVMLEKLRDECFTIVCPLTPKFLVNLVNQDYELFQYTVEFYIRLFGSLFSQLPILPKIENQVISLNTGAKKLEQEIIIFLENQSLPVSIPEVFNQIMIYGSNKENIEDDFFEAIQSVKFNLMATDNPKELFIELSLSAR